MTSTATGPVYSGVGLHRCMVWTSIDRRPCAGQIHDDVIIWGSPSRAFIACWTTFALGMCINKHGGRAIIDLIAEVLTRVMRLGLESDSSHYFCDL